MVMAKFNVGDRIINVRTKDKGTVLKVCPPQRGRQLYFVDYHGVESDELEAFMIADTDLTDPFERCKKKVFGTYEDYSLINTTFKIFNSNNNTISSLAASKTIFKAYQFIPLLKFLNSDNKRILVADEVGLGKTIEAGHIMLEQKARGELRNALIICPNSLQQKWKDELSSKFGITFTIYENKDSLIQDLSDGIVKGIINYEKIRVTKKTVNNNSSKPDLIDYINNNSYRFDLIVCDEAHRLRNSNTQAYKGAKVLIEKANAVVLLTATPIMISTENLYNLLHLMDSDRFSDYQNFNNTLASNRPFLHALSSLNNNVPLSAIADKLRNEEVVMQRSIGDHVYYDKPKTIDELYSSFQLYKNIIHDCTEETDSHVLRSKLQHNLSMMSPLNNVFSRTRKRDVTTDWTQAERRPHTERVTLYERERELFDQIIDEYIDDNSYQDWYGDVRMEQGKALGLVQKKRRVASSVYGFMNDTDSLNQGIDKFKGFPDAKFDKLVEIIKETLSHKKRKVIVFALFKNTIKYLAIRLEQSGYKCVSIHGDIKERNELLYRFKNDPEITVLLSSEVGSEGLDMQFCSSMVNYDLPWNPMVVEQRIGRIDRFGQKSPVVNIYNIVVNDSIQETIYARLLERIGIFRESIGDLESILDRDLENEGYGYENINQMLKATEREFYCEKLTEEEMEEKARQIERAIANESNNLKNIEEGLTNTLTNDIYFINEIRRIKGSKAYITSEELINYINALIKYYMPVCSMEQSESNEYTIKLPLNDPKILTRFLDNYRPNDVEMEKLFSDFKRRIFGETKVNVVFNQEEAYQNMSKIYMNIYNPLVIAASKYFNEKLKENNKKTFCFGIDKTMVSVPVGTYFLAIYRLRTTKTIYGTKTQTDRLVPLLFNVEENKMYDNQEQANNLLGVSQTNGYPLNISKETISESMIDEMRYILKETIINFKETTDTNLRISVETDNQQQIQRTEEEFILRKKSMDKNIENINIELTSTTDDKRRDELSRVITLMKSNLKDLEIQKEEKINKINKSSEISVVDELISLNYIKIE